LSIDDDASYPLEGDVTVLLRAPEILVCWATRNPSNAKGPNLAPERGAYLGADE
jgi:hypothetical protein